jgi:hypothetical protein
LVQAPPGPASGKSSVRWEFADDVSGAGTGRVATILINDKKVGEGRLERPQPGVFSADWPAVVGIDLDTPVVEAVGSGKESRFTDRTDTVWSDAKLNHHAVKAEHYGYRHRTRQVLDLPAVGNHVASRPRAHRQP